MESEAEVEERFFARATAVAERLVAPILADGTVAAIGREAVKDVRDTFLKVFFGEHERHGEIGAPLNPLYSDLAEASDHWEKIMSPGEIARDDRPYQPEAASQQEHDYGYGR